MRVPRRRAGTALLVAAVLLAALAVSVHHFVAVSAASAGPGAGQTPAAGGPASQDTAASTSAAALPSAHVHPDYDTPDDAVDGFYLALLSGTPAHACAYATTPCPSFGSSPITGRVTVIDAVSRGSEALVEVTGTICVSASCMPLTDRVVMPAGPASFAASWTSLISGVNGWSGSPLPCVQDPATRQWHVRLA